VKHSGTPSRESQNDAEGSETDLGSGTIEVLVLQGDSLSINGLLGDGGLRGPASLNFLSCHATVSDT
jgi:hypothetical protein